MNAVSPGLDCRFRAAAADEGLLDFIDELLQIQEHQRAIEVIHGLTDGIRDASDKLKKLLTAIKTPGA